MNGDDLSSARRVAYLISGFVRNTLSLNERVELDNWIGASDENMRLFGELTDGKNILKVDEWLAELEDTSHLEKFQRAMGEERPVRTLSRTWWAAAAVLVLLVGGVTWFGKFRQPVVSIAKREGVVKTTDSIKPGGVKAVLIDQNGKEIDLASPTNKYISLDDNNQAANNFPILNYTTASVKAFNHTLRTPRGGEYQLILPDGTHVWLNAESSLTYPTAFLSNDRTVELAGEAYFEVASDREKPFHVIVNALSDIRVVGTHFNVNAYPNAGAEKISLLEGRIRVKREMDSVDMKPGQQLVRNGNMVKMVNDGDVSSAVAWTRGRFNFDHTPVAEVMQQMGRWYDVEVDYGGDTRLEFSGELYRNSSLQEVLRMLQLSTGEKFTMNGRKIVVRP